MRLSEHILDLIDGGNENASTLGEWAAHVKELEDRLIDLRLGAEMMLEPALNATGTFKRYAEEVKRIATRPEY